MIVPGWVTDPDTSIGVCPQNQTGRYTQCARATRSLQRHDPVVMPGGISKHQGLYSVTEVHSATTAQVGLARLGLEQASLRRFDRAEYRCIACGIPVHTHTKIDFVWARIIRMLTDELQDSVGWLALQ